MFEKEAEEWINKLSNERHFPKDTEYAIGMEEGYTDGFKDGYNKAKEWHFVKNGDLPKENKNYLIFSKEFGIEIRNYYTDTKGWSCRPDRMVIAWTEIPKYEVEE